MGFEVNNGSNGTSNGTSDWPEGVYIDRIEILSVENTTSQYDHDISIKIRGTKPDAPESQKRYDTSWYMNGNHAKDKGVSVDWGSTKSEPPVKGGSWKIRHFLQKLGVESKSPMVEDKTGLSEECIQDCIGRSVFILQYESTKMNQNGNPRRITWFWFATQEEGKKALLDKWKSFDSKPKDYKMEGGKKLANMWVNKPETDTVSVPEV